MERPLDQNMAAVPEGKCRKQNIVENQVIDILL